MSFSLFKSNMAAYMSNPEGIISYAQFAKKLTDEYDMCIRRGLQTTNNIPIQKTNKPGMLTMVTIACQRAFSVREGRHTFIDDIGKGCVLYWTGGALVTGIPPIIPATGAVTNISTTSASVTNPGTWSPVGPEFPTNDVNEFLDKLISAMKNHITTVSGLYITISLYPGFPIVPPAPGIRTWKGWTISG